MTYTERVDERVDKLLALGLRYNGEYFFYRDINIYTNELTWMTDEEFDKAYEGAKLRKQQIEQQESEEPK